MDSKPLSSAEKKELRGVAQRLKPHVNIGKNGLSDSVISEIKTALLKNGLIKIRLDTSRETMRFLCEEIPTLTSCELVGLVGRVGIFFREMPQGN
ncbi:MAG: RNA-binding protein YhbY [Opitutia bacterium UBA7350]|nr:MAG: RNA-binding protein YhbY [Opitutae bacterium UBA7350]